MPGISYLCRVSFTPPVSVQLRATACNSVQLEVNSVQLRATPCKHSVQLRANGCGQGGPESESPNMTTTSRRTRTMFSSFGVVRASMLKDTMRKYLGVPVQNPKPTRTPSSMQHITNQTSVCKVPGCLPPVRVRYGANSKKGVGVRNHKQTCPKR